MGGRHLNLSSQRVDLFRRPDSFRRPDRSLKGPGIDSRPGLLWVGPSTYRTGEFFGAPKGVVFWTRHGRVAKGSILANGKTMGNQDSAVMATYWDLHWSCPIKALLWSGSWERPRTKRPCYKRPAQNRRTGHLCKAPQTECVLSNIWMCTLGEDAPRACWTHQSQCWAPTSHSARVRAKQMGQWMDLISTPDHPCMERLLPQGSSRSFSGSVRLDPAGTYITVSNTSPSQRVAVDPGLQSQCTSEDSQESIRFPSVAEAVGVVIRR